MLFCAVALLAGCGTVNSLLGGTSEKEAKATIEWNYGRNAITIELRSDPRLNIFDDQPHTLVLGVAQMAEPNGFTALLTDTAAVARLLETGEGKAAGLVQFERFVVEPGKSKTFSLDRAQMAQYYGVVAGYYRLDPLQNSRMFRIPTAVKSEGWVVKTRIAAPAPQKIRLILGAERVLGAEQLAPDAEPEGKLAANKGTDGGPGVMKVQPSDVKSAADTAQSVRRLQK